MNKIISYQKLVVDRLGIISIIKSMIIMSISFQNSKTNILNIINNILLNIQIITYQKHLIIQIMIKDIDTFETIY